MLFRSANAMAATILGSKGNKEAFLVPAGHEDQRRNKYRQLDILMFAGCRRFGIVVVDIFCDL